MTWEEFEAAAGPVLAEVRRKIRAQDPEYDQIAAIELLMRNVGGFGEEIRILLGVLCDGGLTISMVPANAFGLGVRVGMALASNGLKVPPVSSTPAPAGKPPAKTKLFLN